MNTIESALTALANVCDGASSEDNQGFNGADTSFGNDLAKQSKLTYKQSMAAYKMLAKYSKQLGRYGIEYDSIPKPVEEEEEEDKVEDLSWYLQELANAAWSEPVTLETSKGWATLVTAPLPTWFWEAYKLYKQEFKEAGYSITKNKNGAWELARWSSAKCPDEEKYVDLPQITTLAYEDLLLPYQRPHTLQLIKSLIDQGAALDASDTGTGKTYTACAVAKELGLFPIVITPKSVKYSYEKVMKNHFKMDGFVSNYEQFKLGKTPYLKKEGEEFKWKVPENALIIFDEVHRCKNYKTQNTAMLTSAKDQKVRVLASSATIGSNPMHFFGLGKLLGLFKNTNGYFDWIHEHGCSRGRFGYEFDNNPDHLKSIHDAIFPDKGSRISIRNLGDAFPETMIIAECYSMSTATKIERVYKDMRKELRELRKKEAEINDTSQLAIMQKARQKVELFKVPTFAEMASDAIEEGHSVAIFVNYNQTIAALAKILETNCLVWGANKGDERQVNVANFQMDKSRIIICNINAGGVGISLHDLRGKHSRVSLISPDWSAENLKQSFGRVHRAGSKTKSIQKVVFAADTIETKVCDKVRDKIARLNMLNDGDLGDVF